jgi:hypothetical protein
MVLNSELVAHTDSSMRALAVRNATQQIPLTHASRRELPACIDCFTVPGVSRIGRSCVCDAVGEYPAAAESCSVLSGSVVVMERVSV